MDIADDLLWDIFTEWLPFESVCHLDSALCEKRRRAEFLALVATKVLLFNREEIRVLTDPYEMDPFTHRALGAAALNWVLKRGIHLASLRIPLSIHNAAEQESIRDAVASLALNGRLDKLETISLFKCSYIEDADLAGILSKCYSSVKSIELHKCYLADSAAAHIKRCTKLEAFAPKGNESAPEMAEIFQSCRKLRIVDLSGFRHRLTDKVVLSVAAHCPCLENLCLECCSAVSDAAVRKVAESCPLLQFVDLMQTNITDATVEALCNRCPLLKRMFLGWCDNLIDAALMTVAERLPGLTHIDLSGIAAITSSAVETLVSKCRELEHIGLTDCRNVSDATLTKIAKHCSKLKVLHVRACPKTTAVGLTKIATKCSNLKTVHIGYGNSSLSSLQDRFPHVGWLE
jgi:hypothetical protein